MESGDIVIGKLDSDVFADEEVEIFSHKECYFLSVFHGIKPVIKQMPEYDFFERPRIHYKKIRGMVVEFDTMNSKKPHTEGLAAVLMGNKVWWVAAKHLQVIKLGKGKI